MKSGNVVWQKRITYPARILARRAQILFGKIHLQLYPNLYVVWQNRYYKLPNNM